MLEVESHRPPLIINDKVLPWLRSNPAILYPVSCTAAEISGSSDQLWSKDLAAA